MVSRQKKGFSLIELLTVLAILGILTSIVSLSYQKIREKVYEKTCLSQMKVIFDASMQYIMDEDFPITGQGLTCNILNKNGYLKQIPKCPKYKKDSKAFYTITGEKKGKVIITCTKMGVKHTHGNKPLTYGDKK